jgi:hypothetical protein
VNHHVLRPLAELASPSVMSVRWHGR